MEFKQQEDSIDVIDWGWFNSEFNDVCYGSIFKHEDGKWWFEPSSDRHPLTCRQLMDIAKKLSDLNI